MITKETVKQRIQDYLLLKISLRSLVEWAEDSFMQAEFDEKDATIISDILSKIGVSNVKNFGIQWHEWNEFLSMLGYEIRIELNQKAV
ncbi:MAG: hypothetical protein IPL26_15925 [Leptospiraceae bacterium]|nr:hypothetical protein [Leptospiraceae bacterium]